MVMDQVVCEPRVDPSFVATGIRTQYRAELTAGEFLRDTRDRVVVVNPAVRVDTAADRGPCAEVGRGHDHVRLDLVRRRLLKGARRARGVQLDLRVRGGVWGGQRGGRARADEE